MLIYINLFRKTKLFVSGQAQFVSFADIADQTETSV